MPNLEPPRVLLEELERRFGRGQILILDEDEVPDALDFLDDVHPQPTNPWGMAPVRFWMTARFRPLDPRTGHALPGQTDDVFDRVGYANELRLILDNSATLGITFCIPGGDDQVLSQMIPSLQQHLPCRLSPKQWRVWRPTKSGTLRSRVLDVSRLA